MRSVGKSIRGDQKKTLASGGAIEYSCLSGFDGSLDQEARTYAAQIHRSSRVG